MSRFVLLGLLELLKTKPHLKRKLKVFAIFGLSAVLVLGALTAYVGVVAAGYVVDGAKQWNVAVQSHDLSGQLEKSVSPKHIRCLETVWGLANIETIWGLSIKDNLESLKQACLPQSQEELI